MRNKSKIKVIILTLGIIFAFLSISNYNFFNDQDGTIEIRDESKLKRLRESGGYTESSIHINDSDPARNWVYTASTYDWCYVDNGVYIIENVTIDAEGSGSGILIENSNEYFIIRNCTIYNANTDPTYGGIKLVNSNYGIIMNNTLYNNANGIYLRYYSSLNNISGNIVFDNTKGIFIYDDCHENTIQENIVSQNEYGIRIASPASFFICDLNVVSSNIVTNNTYGIYLLECDRNTIIDNSVELNDFGIYLYWKCEQNLINDNIQKDNNQGITLNYECDNNSISYNSISGSTIGIFLYDECDSNTLDKNIVTNNDRGISLQEDGQWNNITSNVIDENNIGLEMNEGIKENIFWNNFFTNNTNFGVQIKKLGAGSCFNNLLYNNTFNNPLGVNAKDDGWENYWDNGEIGNWWHDYYGLDEDNDGIGDTPYYISGDSGAIDNYPIYTGRTKETGKEADGVPLVIILIAIISTAAGIAVATITVVLLRKRKRGTEF